MSGMPRKSLPELEGSDEFVARHIGPTASEQALMLQALGLSSLDDLIDRVMPSSIRWDKPLELDHAVSEVDTLARLRDIASGNDVATSVIGMGYYGTRTPNVILR